MLNIPPGSFLLSIALIVCLAFLCGLRGFRGAWNLLRNVKFALVVIALICLFTIVGSTFPQGRTSQAYTQMYGSKLAKFILSFQFDDVFRTFWFNTLLLVLCASILSCLCQRYRLTRMNIGFLITHIGLLVIGAGAIATGFFGTRGRMIIHEGESSSIFFEYKGNKAAPRSLPFSVVCTRFWMDYYDSGNGELIIYRPDGHYETHIQADPGASVRSSAYDATIRVLNVFPDFVMDRTRHIPTTRSGKWRNAAILIEVERNYSKEQEILFYLQPTLRANPALRDILMRYSRDPQSLSVKSYNSALTVVDNGRVATQKTIAVNEPLRYKGYSFYQSDWDKERESFTVLQVKKDPGEKIFYLGGILVIVGVALIFYVNPFLRRRRTRGQSVTA